MANQNTTRRISMPALPAMPKAAKIKATRPCACGCERPTKSTWFTGHDGRAHGWATRVNRGIMKMEEVPANERKGAMLMMDRVKREAAERAAEELESKTA